MATNNYFQRGDGPGRKSEQDLVESTIIEMIKMAGQDFYYIKRTLVKVDPILNEDPLSQFSEYAILEMYVNNAQQYGGQGHLLGQFGLDVSDQIELVVSKKRVFEELNLDAPNEGDLLYFPLMRSLWQISFIEDEVIPFYALSNLYTFSIKASRYIYSHEDFDTGVPKIDEVNDYTTPFAKNDEINDEANDHLDFSEDNPFGSISEDDSDR